MNYKCLALVGALLFAAPAHALTETAKANPGDQVQVKDSLSIFSLLAGDYRFSLSAETTKNATGYLTAKLVNVMSNLERVVTVTFSSPGSGSTFLDFKLDTAGNFRIDWLGNAKNGTVGGTATLQATTVAVPGPEAGAGVGALAMAGVAYMVSRRRKIVAAK